MKVLQSSLSNLPRLQSKREDKSSDLPIDYFKIERPLELSPYIIAGEKLILICLMPEHGDQLYEDIFSKSDVMKYFGVGRTYTRDEFTGLHIGRIRKNMELEHDKSTRRLIRFTWTVLTHDGIAGRINIFPSPDQGKNKTELAFCISPKQQGRALAKRASELIVGHLGEDTSFIITVHPEHKASIKTIENICYPNGKFVFFKDLERQNVTAYSQLRNYYLSKEIQKIKFYSFYKEQIIEIVMSDTERLYN